VTYYVQKNLGMGPIRFGVTPRRTVGAIDSDRSLSTGPHGQFAGRAPFFFTDATRVEATLPTQKSIATIPFRKSLTPGFLGMMVVGALFILLGLAVVARKGPQGFVEIILGLALIIAPLVVTAQRRRIIREQEAKERAEREATEKRNREMLAAYTAALEQLRAAYNDETVAAVRREQQQLDLPHDIWWPVARRTVMQIGFDALAELGPPRAREVARRMDDAGRAAGLPPHELKTAKQQLYETVLWHLIADDRLGDAQAAELLEIRKGFDIWDTPPDTHVIEQLERLRGIGPKNLPNSADCGAPLQFQEHCIHRTSGTLMELRRGRWSEEGPCTVMVTNKRLIVSSGKWTSIELQKIDDISIAADDNILTIEYGGAKQPIHVRVDDPFVTASLLDIVAGIDTRPKAFA
jgi:hypothetical protein